MNEYMNVDYRGAVLNSKKPKDIRAILYYPDEVFTKSHELPGVIVGNFGTIIDEDTGYKLPWSTIHTGEVVVNKTIRPTFSTYTMRAIRVDLLVMVAYCPLDDYRGKYILHKDGSPYHIIYAPGTPWHNMEWTTKMRYYKNLDRFPKRIIPKRCTFRKYTEELVDDICRMLFADHIPVNEVVRILQAKGCDIDRNTVINFKYHEPKKWAHIINKYKK